MLKKFLIHEHDKDPVGELIYDTDKSEFILKAYENVEPTEMPAFMYFMLKENKPIVKYEYVISETFSNSKKENNDNNMTIAYIAIKILA